MRNLDMALRTTGQVMLLERGHAQALLDQSIEERRPQGRGLLSRAMSMVGLRPKAMEDDDDGPSIDRSRLAMPQISWAGTVEWGEGYAIVGKVAIIDIEGVLTPDGYIDWWNWCWVGGYSQIGSALRAARADNRVDAVLLRIDSPGGFVDGCFDLADEIAAGNAKAGGKPVWVHARMACSAAYALASAADRVIALSEADVGSIGVLVMHVDVSAFYAEHGIKIEAIQSGARKTDGAEWKPLSEDARTHLQSVVDQIARRFTATVTSGRPISADDVAAMQARWFLAQHDDAAQSGLALKLVDAIGTDQAAYTDLSQSLTDDTGGAPAASGRNDPKRAATQTTESDMKLSEQIAALRDKAAKGDAAAIAELKALGVSLKADTSDPKDDPEDEEDKTDRGADEAAEDEGEEDDTKEPKSTATGNKAAFALLRSSEAKGRTALANRLAEKVASGKLTYGDAKDMLADSGKSGRLSEAMGGRDHNPGNDHGGGGQAGAGLGSAVDRLLAKKGQKAVA